MDDRYYISVATNGCFIVNDMASKFVVVNDDGSEEPSHGVAFGLTLSQAQDEIKRRRTFNLWGA